MGHVNWYCAASGVAVLGDMVPGGGVISGAGYNTLV